VFATTAAVSHTRHFLRPVDVSGGTRVSYYFLRRTLRLPLLHTHHAPFRVIVQGRVVNSRRLLRIHSYFARSRREIVASWIIIKSSGKQISFLTQSKFKKKIATILFMEITVFWLA
jgi:hypothetical protein